MFVAMVIYYLFLLFIYFHIVIFFNLKTSKIYIHFSSTRRDTGIIGTCLHICIYIYTYIQYIYIMTYILYIVYIYVCII